MQKNLKNSIKNGKQKIINGEYLEAKKHFFNLLQEDPNNIEILNTIGLIFANEENYIKAIEFFSKAISISDNVKFIKYNRGLSYHKLNQLDNALIDYSDEIKINPNYPDVWYNRAIIYEKLFNYEESIKNYDTVISLNPNNKEAFHNKGLVLISLNKYQESIQCFDSAILIDSDYQDSYLSKSEALVRMMLYSKAIEVLKKYISIDNKAYIVWFNLGTIYLKINEYENAINSLLNAVTINPLFEEAYLNLGNAYKFKGDFINSLTSYNKSLEINKNYFDALINKGVLFQEFMLNKNAMECYENAISLNQMSAAAWLNKGNLFHNLKKYSDAISCYQQALSIDNSMPEIYFSIGKTLVQMGEYQESIFFFDKLIQINPEHPYLFGEIINAKTKICSWVDIEIDINNCLSQIAKSKDACQPFYTVGFCDDPMLQKKCSELYINKNFPPINTDSLLKNWEKSKKIKIGYYSSDFHNHATAHLIAGLFEHHNKDKFEIYGFSFGPVTNDIKQIRIKDSFDFFYNLEDASDLEVVSLSRHIGINIAIDLKGFTTGSRTRIFSYRVAPIQINFLGYPGTMGADYIDYLIADEYVIPLDYQKYYSEKIIYLPDCYQINDTLNENFSISNGREEFGLPQNAFVYCSFNNNYKITFELFKVWMNILKSVKNSVIWLLQDNEFAVKNLKNAALQLGVDPNRLIFAKRSSWDFHIARHSFADLFLDTYPCNAHTTASDALRAGLPLITISGDTFASRVAGSLLKTVGLDELIFRNYDDYQSTAVELAFASEKLLAVKEKLKFGVANSSLFKPKVFARNLENSFEKIMQDMNIE